MPLLAIAEFFVFEADTKNPLASISGVVASKVSQAQLKQLAYLMVAGVQHLPSVLTEAAHGMSNLRVVRMSGISKLPSLEVSEFNMHSADSWTYYLRCLKGCTMLLLYVRRLEERSLRVQK